MLDRPSLGFSETYVCRKHYRHAYTVNTSTHNTLHPRPGLPYAETRRRLAELLLASAQRLVLPLVARGRMLSARLAWARMSVHFVQLVGWALQEVHVDNLSLYVTVAWDLSALLASSCSSHLLQGAQTHTPH